MALNEDAVNQVVGEVLGGQGRPMSGVQGRAKLKLDNDQLGKATELFAKLNTTIKSIKENMAFLKKDANVVAAALNTVNGAAGGGGRNPTSNTLNGVANAVNTSPNVAQTVTAQMPATGGGGPPGGPPPSGGVGGGGGRLSGVANGVAGALSAAAPVLSAGVSAMDQRIDRGMNYALAADRMSVLYQQMTGKSRLQVQQEYRQPLTKYRLDINPMLQMQATTGLNAQRQAGTVEALRTISGFSLGTTDATNMLSALARPETVNRMFMMTGQSIYGMGGQQNTGMQVIQNITRMSGLTNKRIAETAMQQGSVTRARLRQMGLPEDMIETVLQYAQQNISFRAKGGKGMYNPENKDQRKLMGIEDNFATQVEETKRVKQAREERFYRTQADNMADLEKATQSLTKMFGSLEEKLGGLIGARASSRGWQRLLGGALKIGGLFGMAAATTMTGGLAGAAAFGAGGILSGGDPKEDNSATNPASNQTGTKSTSTSGVDLSSIYVPTWTGKTRLSDVVKRPSFTKLNKRFADRVLKMMIDNPRVGWGEGFRSGEQQKKMFLGRYRRTDKKTEWYYDGSYWEHVSGNPAAPPGRSMHEIGLAADLVGDLDWVTKNAGKYGLKNFANVNNEPWHVQPSELPNSRRKYEQQGAPWGTDGSADNSAPPGDNGNPGSTTDYVGDSGVVESKGAGSSGRTTGTVGKSKGMSISEIFQMMQEVVGTSLGSSTGLNGGPNSGYTSSSNDQAPISGATANVGKQLSGEQVAKHAFNAGFRKDLLVKMVAISKRESQWNSGAFNPNKKTRDQAYGLWQINMLGELGQTRMKYFQRKGLPISKYEDLFDGGLNARAAKALSDAYPNDPLNPWGGYKHRDPMYKTDIKEAEKVVDNAGLLNRGDPPEAPALIMRQSNHGSQPVYMSGGDSYTIAPNIYMTGNGGNQTDLMRIAKEVARLIHSEMKLTATRRG